MRDLRSATDRTRTMIATIDLCSCRSHHEPTGTPLEIFDSYSSCNHVEIINDAKLDNNRIFFSESWGNPNRQLIGSAHGSSMRVYALNKRGVIPEAITAFKYLTFLNIDQNFFTGPLPTFIGNLTSLKLLSISHNLFSGPIPKELGNLKDLHFLSFGSNNFSGTLPPELGNLVKLEQ
ncbi:hypothetical protein TIFTF001_040110, partial [Ficus carica]